MPSAAIALDHTLDGDRVGNIWQTAVAEGNVIPHSDTGQLLAIVNNGNLC
jgi:hypothetical protein